MKPTIDRQDFANVTPAQTANTGLLAGSLIMTLDGERPVSSLAAGDRIVTRDRGASILRELRSRRITTPAVKIKARSLGHNRPDHDTTLPVGQPILVRDWRAEALFGAKQALVSVDRLVDGEFVTLQDPRKMTVYDLIFDDPHVLYVDGLEVASHLGEDTLR